MRRCFGIWLRYVVTCRSASEWAAELVEGHGPERVRPEPARGFVITACSLLGLILTPPFMITNCFQLGGHSLLVAL